MTVLPEEPTASTSAAAFQSLAEVVYGSSTFEDIYAAISRAAVEVIPGCDHACITTMVAGKGLECHGATDDVAAQVDRFEREVGEGPCLDAITERKFQIDPDITHRPTWPELSRLVLSHTPVRGLIGYRLLVGDRKAGALNVLSDTPGVLTASSADMGAVLAAFASTALGAAAHSERAAGLLQALQSNREIGQAVGFLMATHGLDEAAAIGLLREVSMDLNLRLREVALAVVNRRGELPSA
ncbi:MAG TPA: GAF and ANTAR domain-containing protein [Marmoricola sp.]|jgi:GAF domain-containing protein|nr:GAF and ANTAR domain-containing protein [Marmoricola sp.]